MNLRKVYGGTPVGQGSRCDMCIYSRVIRGYAQSEKITLCDRIFEPMLIPFPVSECTDYLDKRLPSIEDLEEIAWILRSKNAGKKAGFVPLTALTDPVEDDEPGQEEQPRPEPEQVPAVGKGTKH